MYVDESTPTVTPEQSDREPVRRGLRQAPVSKRGLATWLVAYVVLTALAIVVGLMITDQLAGRADSTTTCPAGWAGTARSSGTR